MSKRTKTPADIRTRSPIVRERDASAVVLLAIELQLGRPLTSAERRRGIRDYRTLVASFRK